LEIQNYLEAKVVFKSPMDAAKTRSALISKSGTYSLYKTTTKAIKIIDRAPVRILTVNKRSEAFIWIEILVGFLNLRKKINN
jgi:hypothetical protein